VKVLNLCISLTVNTTVLSTASSMEQQYQAIFKKLISYLYKTPDFKITFSFSGPQLEWFEKKHPEFIAILKELISRKQVEIMGGGYYNPVFPLLSPIDRTGQIELLTSELRRLTGKRPRGMSILSSVWDRTLIPCFQNCGMEWVQLDSSIIPSQNRNFLAQIVSDQGKTIKILSAYRNLEQVADKEISADSYINSLFKQIEKSTKNDQYNYYTQERVICVNVETESAEYLVKHGWFEELFKTIEKNYKGKVKLNLPTEYLKNAQEFVPSFISAGIRDDIAKWSIIPYEAVENKSNFPLTINNFLLTYSRCHALYNRELYISMLITNCHGDKARKQAARQSLWKAQTGDALICSPDGVFANNALRQSAYKNLSDAEKFIREATDFKECVTSFDYNADGHNEYICMMEKYTACISPRAGEINELNINGNYADNLTRIAKFDKVTDDYERGLFIEHVFDKNEFSDYKKGTPTGCGIFSKVLFKEVEFNGTKKEIKLKGEGTYSNLNLPVSLRKKYLLNSNGFTVQYILKNEGPIAFKGNFVVESNFAQTDFTSAQTNSYKVDLISNGDGITYDQITKPASQKSVSFIQITDTSNNISFVYEPNEESGLCCRPLYFKRPSVNSSSGEISGTTFVSSLFWDVDLAAGMEMEKTINFTIITPKKRRTKKS